MKFNKNTYNFHDITLKMAVSKDEKTYCKHTKFSNGNVVYFQTIREM